MMHRNPPPPASAGLSYHMDEPRARMALGKDFPLWKRLGDVAAEHPDVGWMHLWKAAHQLIEEGHAPRDRRVVELARQLMHDEQAYFENMEQRRRERQERREQDGSTNSEGPSVDGG